MRGDVVGAMLYHLGGLAEEGDVPPPERRPGLLPFLYAESEKHYGVEDRPGAVGEVAESAVSFFDTIRRLICTHSMQNALFHLRLCWIYTAVSVCTAKLTKLTNRNPAAIVYLFFVALCANSSRSRS